jgi:hypothetical protein
MSTSLIYLYFLIIPRAAKIINVLQTKSLSTNLLKLSRLAKCKNIISGMAGKIYSPSDINSQH